jgi:hypothetical protein
MPEEREEMRQPEFPPGWDEERVRKVIAHYESQSEEEALAEDEAALEDPKQTVMVIPNELVPAVRQLLAKRGG